MKFGVFTNPASTTEHHFHSEGIEMSLLGALRDRNRIIGDNAIGLFWR